MNMQLIDINIGDMFWFDLLSFEINNKFRSLLYIEYYRKIWKIKFLFINIK